jgi:hypothetical protein
MNKTEELENIQQIVEDLENVEHFVNDPEILDKINTEIKNLKTLYAEEIQANGKLGTVEEARAIPSLPFVTLNVSGHYGYKTPKFKSSKPVRIVAKSDSIMESSLPDIPILEKSAPLTPPLYYYSEALRLDVDGRYPQMAASGTIVSLFINVHWIANLKKTGPNNWEGKIWYKHGSTTFFKYNFVKILVVRSPFTTNKSATAIFSGPDVTNRTVTLKFLSTYSHDVELEFDYEEGITPIVSIQTHDHPNRPSTLASENLSIDTVFRRAGFNVKHTASENKIPPALKGTNGKWSDNEMHDAMQTYWSKFADIPQWSLWTLFAKQHDMGNSLGGIMFDDIGPNHRQGTAIFYDSFIKNAPADDSDKPAWVKRMMFWTAVHEMGHAFNLAHSWQKELGTGWIPTLADEPEARSFMNYPYNVSGGESTFFEDFEFRFSNQELLFMRHAPSQFVQMGNADWFDNHAFEWANVSNRPALQLIARVNRPKEEFEFMEPVKIELKLKNTSDYPETISESILKDAHEMTIVVKRNNDPAKLYFPYAVRCFKAGKCVLHPGESLYESLFLSAGTKGWIIDEPGYYTIQICVHGKDEDIVSNSLKIRVNPPRNYDESYIAQDYFNDAVSRILAFNGSCALENGNAILREVSEKLKTSKAAYHANIALAQPLIKDYKTLDFQAIRSGHICSVANAKGTIKMRKANNEEANKLFEKAMPKNVKNEKAVSQTMQTAIETIGHIDSKAVVDNYTQSLVDDGQKKEAVELQEGLLKVYESKGVIKSVQNEVKDKIKQLKGEK